MSSKFEDAVAHEYERQGWEVMRSGWPDMLLVRRNDAGELELKAVEVKADRDELRENQKRMCAALSTVMQVRDVHQGYGYGGSFKVDSPVGACSAYELVYDRKRYEDFEKGSF